MKYGMDARVEAVRCFEMGFADKMVGRLLGIPSGTIRKWLYAYRALGKEALFVTKHKTYSHDLKVEAARAVIEGRMSKPEAMATYGVKGKTQIDEWCRLYREEELEARVRELELENEILKRFNALAEDIERRRQTR